MCTPEALLAGKVVPLEVVEDDVLCFGVEVSKVDEVIPVYVSSKRASPFCFAYAGWTDEEKCFGSFPACELSKLVLEICGLQELTYLVVYPMS